MQFLKGFSVIAFGANYLIWGFVLLELFCLTFLNTCLMEVVLVLFLMEFLVREVEPLFKIFITGLKVD
jgi:hypothetical protein